MTKIYFRQALNYTAVCCCSPGHSLHYINLEILINRQSYMDTAPN